MQTLRQSPDCRAPAVMLVQCPVEGCNHIAKPSANPAHARIEVLVGRRDLIAIDGDFSHLIQRKNKDWTHVEQKLSDVEVRAIGLEVKAREIIQVYSCGQTARLIQDLEERL